MNADRPIVKLKLDVIFKRVFGNENNKDIIAAFVKFREEVIRRRTVYKLNKARDRAHILVGLAIAVENLDPVIELIRTAPSPTVQF